MKKENKIKKYYIQIFIFLFAIMICIYGFDVLTSKYIIFDGSGEEYQLLVDLNTQNTGSLIDVNYSTLITFLENDKTNEHPYSSSFNCVDFSLMLLHNASLQNISSGIVLLDYHEDTNHCISCFFTTDEGLIFIEPQSDNDKTSNVKVLGIYSSHTIYGILTYWN